MELPAAVARGVGAAARVVIGEARSDIVCETNVRTAGITHTPQDIGDALRCQAWPGAVSAMDEALSRFTFAASTFAQRAAVDEAPLRRTTSVWPGESLGAVGAQPR